MYRSRRPVAAPATCPWLIRWALPRLPRNVLHCHRFFIAVPSFLLVAPARTKVGRLHLGRKEVVVKGGFSKPELVKHHTGAPNVHRPTDLGVPEWLASVKTIDFALHHFRRHVAGRPAHTGFRVGSVCVVGQFAAPPEIRDFERTPKVDEEIVRLQIAVHNPHLFAVQKPEPRQQLQEDARADVARQAEVHRGLPDSSSGGSTCRDRASPGGCRRDRGEVFFRGGLPGNLQQTRHAAAFAILEHDEDFGPTTAAIAPRKVGEQLQNVRVGQLCRLPLAGSRQHVGRVAVEFWIGRPLV
mmetsp:Transcript_12585/g.30627  ORF Transcript_12585/g.30627 Transcript_12585/m.30627 type:complete len:298 (+) Transcript_12585:2010-2903(+)